MNNKKMNLIFVMFFILIITLPVILGAETQTGTETSTQGFKIQTSEDGKTTSYTAESSSAKFEYKFDGVPQQVSGLMEGAKITTEKSGNGEMIKDIQATGNSQNTIQLNGMNVPLAPGTKITGGGNLFNINPISGSQINGEPKPSPGTSNLRTEVGYTGNNVKFIAENGDKYTLGQKEYNLGKEEKKTGELIFDKNGKYFKDSLYLNDKIVLNTGDTNVRVFTNGLRQENSNSPYVSMRQAGIKTSEAIVTGGSKDSAGPAVVLNNLDSKNEEYFVFQSGKGTDLTYSKAPGQMPSIDVYGKEIFSMRDAALQISSDGKNMLKRYDSSSVYQSNENFKDFYLSVWGENDKLLYQYGVVKDADRIPIAGQVINGQIDNPFGSGKLTTTSALNSINVIKKNWNFISDFSAASELENSPVTQESIQARYGELMKADTLFQIPVSSGAKPSSDNNIFYNLVDGVFGNNRNSQEQVNLESLRNTLYTPSGLKDAPYDVRVKSPVLQLPLYLLLPDKLQNDISPGSTATQEQIQQEFYKFIRDNSNGDPKLFAQAYPEFVKKYQNYIPPEARIFLSAK